jgi:hypothetical protein
MLIEQVVFGELAVDDPRVVRALADLPGLREELEGMLVAQRAVAATAAMEKAVLAASTADLSVRLAPAPTTAQRSRPRRARLVVVSLAAVAMVAAGAWWWRQTPPPQQHSVWLGGTKIERVECAKTAQGFRLSWNGSPAAGLYYRLKVVDEAGRELLALPELTRTSEWTIPADSTAGWPARVWLELASCDAMRMVRGAPLRVEFVLPR